MSTRQLRYTDAVNEAIMLAMRKDPKVLFYGLGATDPKRLFGTSKNLVETFGEDRVFDMPTAENAMTGVGVGAALAGYKPIMCHQRLDFFLLAMDQLVNSAAKWHFTFGGQDSVPITIRLILGRGWGQGPTHCQNLQAWFAHIPGLKVVMPSNPRDAKALMYASIFDPNPVVFLEHRWLHDQVGEVEEGVIEASLGKAHKLRDGKDLTIVSSSFMTVEAIHAIDALSEHGISCELIDLATVSPLDRKTILDSVKKTGRVLVCDSGAESFGVASEIVSTVSTQLFSSLKCAPRKLASPDCPVPTSFGLSEKFYPRAEDIVREVIEMVYDPAKAQELSKKQIIPARKLPHDVPGDWFKGPF